MSLCLPLASVGKNILLKIIYYVLFSFSGKVFSALTLLIGCQEEHPVCKKIE